MYPSEPTEISRTIEAGLDKTRKYRKQHPCVGWRDLEPTGKIIFCSICKALRSSDFGAADITTLNFNVMFEIGFTLGLRLPVAPVQDRSFLRDEEKIKALGLFDTIGWEPFENSDDIVRIMSGNAPKYPLSEASLAARRAKTPTLFFLRSPYDTDHSIYLRTALSRSAFQLNVFDTHETPRLSVQDAIRKVFSTYGTVAHLISSERKGAEVHNARCAFVSGLAMASQKPVLMLQDGTAEQPVDYRDVVQLCRTESQIKSVVREFVREAMESHEALASGDATTSGGLLAEIDLGEPAAENETQELKGYFVDTAEYRQVARGRTQIVVGRKGAGKTAMALYLKNRVWKSSEMVVELRPEGHQLMELKDIVLQNLTAGMQAHTMTAFWTYLLTLELAFSIITDDSPKSQREREKAGEVKLQYEQHAPFEDSDFPARLLHLVERIKARFEPGDGGVGEAAVTNFLYAQDLKPLSKAVAAYLKEKESVWLLVDNLDKGWPTRGASTEDILIVRTVLEASNKLQRSLKKYGVSFRSIVFLRQDIYAQLIDQTPDRGKQSVVQLSWTDIDLMKELVRLRIEQSTGLQGGFSKLWNHFFAGHVGGTDSFLYVAERSLARPRDVLNYVLKAVGLAVNRGHAKVTEDDLTKAEEAYSQDMFQDLFYELRDVYPKYAKALYAFEGLDAYMDEALLDLILGEHGVSEEETPDIVEILLWYGFLGVVTDDKEYFSYSVGYDLERLRSKKSQRAFGGSGVIYCVHPAFRMTLNIQLPSR